MYILFIRIIQVTPIIVYCSTLAQTQAVWLRKRKVIPSKLPSGWNLPIDSVLKIILDSLFPPILFTNCSFSSLPHLGTTATKELSRSRNKSSKLSTWRILTKSLNFYLPLIWHLWPYWSGRCYPSQGWSTPWESKKKKTQPYQVPYLANASEPTQSLLDFYLLGHCPLALITLGPVMRQLSTESPLKLLGVSPKPAYHASPLPSCRNSSQHSSSLFSLCPLAFCSILVPHHVDPRAQHILPLITSSL